MGLGGTVLPVGRPGPGETPAIHTVRSARGMSPEGAVR
jgi:hypothetical protein